MKVKTESGVSITIIEEGSSKVLMFDKSVRAVELNREETSKLSALLSSNRKAKSSTNTEFCKTQNNKEAASEGR
jgi:hypothetical protein